MALSNDLISQFAKITNDKDTRSKASTITGTVVVHGGTTYVKMDGSELLTPVFTTTEMKAGDRVTVTIKDHIATATGNTTSPAARIDDVATMFHQATEGDIAATTAIIADLKAYTANIKNLSASDLAAINASVDELMSKYAHIDKLSAKDVEILNAEIENLRTQCVKASEVVTDQLEAEQIEAAIAEIDKLVAKNAEFNFVSADRFSAALAEIQTLDVEKLTAAQGDFRYATIDFANIGEAAMEFFYSKSGLIENVKVGDQTIAGELVGVTIRGDRLIGNTIVADKLVIRGDDGLYYKLNAQGVSPEGKTEERVEYTEVGMIETPPPDGILVVDATTSEGHVVYCYVDDSGLTKYYSKSENGDFYEVTAEARTVHLEQTVENSLNGSIITAHSITATQITVNDLVAFDATIGRFVIDGDADDENATGSIHTVGKSSIDSSTEGIYMDSSGQVNIGGSNSFIKYVRNEDGSYSLAISAESIEFALTRTDENGNTVKETRSLATLGNIGEYVRITKLDDKPCIELGEADSDFKLYITNTSIKFMDGSVCPAYVTNQTLYIDKAVVENELQFGQFIWQQRYDDDGNPANMGIVWLDREVDG